MYDLERSVSLKQNYIRIRVNLALVPGKNMNLMIPGA